MINPNNQWGDNQRHQSKQYHILGLPKDGTLAEFVTVDANKIRLAPQHLSIEQAAALPLAGLTAYRALFGRAQLQAGEKVLIKWDWWRCGFICHAICDCCRGRSVCNLK